MERLHGNGTQLVLLPSTWQQVLKRLQATGGDGGGSGRSSAGSTDDHTPGPAMDCEPEDTLYLNSLSDIRSYLSVTSLPVSFGRSPASCCLR